MKLAHMNSTQLSDCDSDKNWIQEMSPRYMLGPACAGVYWQCTGVYWQHTCGLLPPFIIISDMNMRYDYAVWLYLSYSISCEDCDKIIGQLE